MANYPAYSILLTSSQEQESGIDDDFSQGGAQHSRIFHSQAYYTFSLDHFLTLAQWNSLVATYAAGPRDVYTLTYHAESPAVTYSVKFTSPPVKVSNSGADYYFVTSKLRGTKV